MPVSAVFVLAALILAAILVSPWFIILIIALALIAG